MAETPDYFGEFERDDRPMPLTPDDLAFLNELNIQANEAFDAADQTTIENLGLCKLSYEGAINQRNEILMQYMSNKYDAELGALVKANEIQLFTQFHEYVGIQLRAPAEYGPQIVAEIAAALSMADMSQASINMDKDKKLYQFDDLKKLEISIMNIIAAKNIVDTQALIQELYKRHIYDVVVMFVDSNLQQ